MYDMNWKLPMYAAAANKNSNYAKENSIQKLHIFLNSQLSFSNNINLKYLVCIYKSIIIADI
jgi:hypothetical protein